MLIAESSGRYVLTSNCIHTESHTHIRSPNQPKLEFETESFHFRCCLCRSVVISLYLIFTVRRHSIFDTNGFNAHTHTHFYRRMNKKNYKIELMGVYRTQQSRLPRWKRKLIQLLPYTAYIECSSHLPIRPRQLHRWTIQFLNWLSANAHCCRLR